MKASLRKDARKLQSLINRSQNQQTIVKAIKTLNEINLACAEATGHDGIAKSRLISLSDMDVDRQFDKFIVQIIKLYASMPIYKVPEIYMGYNTNIDFVNSPMHIIYPEEEDCLAKTKEYGDLTIMDVWNQVYQNEGFLQP